MACGCGKRSAPRTVTMRPTIGPRPIQGGTAAGPSPAELRAIGLQKNVSVGEARRMDEQRLRLEKLRRAAITAKLNK